MNRYHLIFILLLCSGAWLQCNRAKVDKRGADLAPPDGKLLYLAHQHTYQQDQEKIFSALPTAGPEGLVLYSSLLLDLSTNLTDSRELAGILPFFQAREGLKPVLLMYVDKTQYQPLCEGRFDENIAKLAGFLRQLNRPVYLSVGVEVNNPLYENDPEQYKAAYRCFVDKLTAQQVDNVSFLWYVTSMKPGYQGLDPEAWYPGDEYVNWLATSLYKFQEDHFVEKPLFTGSGLDHLLQFSEERELPVMIVESSATSVKKNFALSGAELWGYWYEPFFALILNHGNIKAFSHLNNGWEGPVVRERWLEKIGHNRILKGNGGEPGQVGYSSVQ